jgi:hypothetical protein
MSFRWLANAFVPGTYPRKRALFAVGVLTLAGCAGGGSPTVERTLHGTGYRFAAPAEWRVVRSGREVRAERGLSLVSVTRYPLLRAYRPELWDHVLPELDRAAAGLAAQQSGKVGESSTVTVAGRRARRYDIDYTRDGKRLVERIAFVLRGRTEYLLLCRYEGGGGTDACDRLLMTFTLLRPA